MKKYLHLKTGDRGPMIVDLRRMLIKAGETDIAPTKAFFNLPLEKAVRDFQRSKNLVVDGIVGPITWKALEASFDPNYLQFIIVHCTATKALIEVDKDDILRWHLEGRGWKAPGYSDMIHLDGLIENLWPYDQDQDIDPWELTNGARGFNSVSRHVVYVGGLDEDGHAQDTKTIHQDHSLYIYLQEKILRYPDIKILGHNEVDPNKACPSFDVAEWLLRKDFPTKNIFGYKAA